MKKYELLLILPGTLNDEESKSQVGKVVETLKEYAQDVELNSLGKNRLAYPIRQIRYGYFYTVVFLTDSDKLAIIYEKLNLMRDLLRAMVTHFNDKASSDQKITYFMEEGSLLRKKEGDKDKKEKAVEERVFMDKEVAIEQAEEPLGVITPSKAEAEIVEKEGVKTPVRAKSVDLKEIDKKLDEILSDNTIMSDV